jgi:hypothetical protein
MRVSQRWAAGLFFVVLSLAAPALARRPSCAELVAARHAGQSPAAVAQAFGTTTVRVDACTQVETRHQRFAEARQRFAFRRAERGLEQ